MAKKKSVSQLFADMETYQAKPQENKPKQENKPQQGQGMTASTPPAKPAAPATTASAAPAKAQPKKNEAFTQEQRQAAIDQVEQMRQQVAASTQRTMNRMDYAMAGAGLNVPRVTVGEKNSGVKVGQNRRVVATKPKFNAQSGKMERTYITEVGNEYSSRAGADLEQNLIDKEASQALGLNMNAQQISAAQQPANAAVAALWKEAEAQYKADREKNAKDVYGDRKWYDALLHAGREMHTVDASVNAHKNDVSHMTRFDLQNMMDNAWKRVGKQMTASCYEKLRKQYPNAVERQLQMSAEQMARSLSDNAVYNYAVAQNTPKSTLEFFAKTAADTNLLRSIRKGLARSEAGTTGDMAAYEQAMSEYGKNHRWAQIGGTIAGMMFDPTTYLAGGVGSGASKLALGVGGRIVANKAATSVGARLFGSTLTGRVAAGLAGGAGNFATYEGIKEGESQFVHGGHINAKTGESEGYSAGEVLSSSLHGALLGGVTGTFSPLLGNVADKWVKATSNTAGKVGIRAGEFATSTLAEGTIFSVPEWISGDRDKMDVWTDNVAMMLGFKGKHVVETAPRVIAGMRPVAEPKTMEERNHNRMNFMERLRTQMNASPSDMAFTKEEREELQRSGYGDLASLFAKTPKQKEKAKPNAKSTTTDGKTMNFDIPVADAEDMGREWLKQHPGFDGYEAMERLVQDPSVSQSARAKAYFILTGRRLPMGTVSGCTTEQDDKGNIYVKSVTADGEVVTNRRFADEASAKKEEDKIMRQVELNSVDVGERYTEAKADSKVWEAAVEAVAPGADPETVKRNYQAAKQGDKDALDNYGEMVDALDKFMEENRGMADAERPEAIRAAIKEETDVDVDDAIKKEPSKRTEPEQAAVEDYLRRLFPEQEPETERPMSDDEAGASAIYDQARLLWDKADGGEGGNPTTTATEEGYTRGYNATDEEQPEVVKAYDAAKKKAAETLGYDWTQELEAAEDGHCMLVVQQYAEEGNTEKATALLNYLNAKSALDGMKAAEADKLEDALSAQREIIYSRSNGQGYMQEATLKEDNKKVWLTSGDVVVDEEGRIDTSKSGKTLVVIDEEGHREMIAPSALSSLGERTSYTDALEAAQEQLKQEWAKKNAAVAAASTEGESKEGTNPTQGNTEASQAQNGGEMPTLAYGDRVTLKEADGSLREYTVNRIDEDGIEVASENGVKKVKAEELAGTAQSVTRNGEQPLWQREEQKPTFAKGQRYEINGREYTVADVGEDGMCRLENEDGAFNWYTADLEKALKDGRASMVPQEAETPNTSAEEQAGNGGSGQPQLTGRYSVNKQAVANASAEDYHDIDSIINLDFYSENPDRVAEDMGNQAAAAAEYLNGNIDARQFLEKLGYATGENTWLDQAEAQEMEHEANEEAQKYVPYLQDSGESVPTTPESVPTGSEAPAETAAPQAEETRKTEEAPEPMPMTTDKKKRPTADYSKATPQRAYKYIAEELGFSRDEQREFINLKLKAAEERAKGKGLKKPKMSESPEEYKEAKERYEAAIKEAKAQVEYWTAVKTEMDNAIIAERKADEEHQRMLTERAQEEERKRLEAKRKAEEEAERTGSNAVGGTIKERWDNAPKVEGLEDEIVLPSGETVKGHYVLTESGAASASHQSTNGFAPTEGFPVDENGQNVNDRDYHRDTEAQQVTRTMAAGFDQRALQQPVVVSQDGVVLSGNGRTMAGEIAAETGTDGKYVDYLRSHAAKYGFTEEQVAQMSHPRVVFVPDEHMPYTTETFGKFNQRSEKSQSKTETAVKMGKLVDDNTFGRVMRTIGGYSTLGEFYNDDNATTEVVRQLVGAGVIPQTELAQLFDGGKLSENGQALLESLLVGKVFAANPDAVRQITETKSMRQAVMNALQEVVANSRLKNGYDLSGELAQAIDLVYQARKNGYRLGDSVSSYALQLNLFPEDDGVSAADFTNATVMMLANVLNDSRVTQLKKVIALYNSSAEDASLGIGDLLSGGEVRKKEDIIKDIKEYLKNGNTQEQQKAVEEAVAQRQRRAVADEETGTTDGRNEEEQPETGVRNGGDAEHGQPAGSSETNPSEATAENGSNGLRNNERGRAEGSLDERQGDLEKTGDVDENGHAFIPASDGTTVFGEITEDCGLTPAPIKLSEGFNETDEKGNNIGYGLLHIEAGHGKQILKAGYSSVQEFVEDVCRNYKEIRIGKGRENGRTYMLLELHDEKHKRTLYVELSHDGTYWNVNSGGIFKTKYTDKKDIVWPEPTVGSNANTDTAEVVDSPTEAAKGETVDRGGNSSQAISSGSKGKDKSQKPQGNAENAEAGKDDVSPEDVERFDRLGEIEGRWEEKIQDYVYEHYPLHSVMRAHTPEEEAAYKAESEAMKKDAVLKKMREDAKAEFDAADIPTGNKGKASTPSPKKGANNEAAKKGRQGKKPAVKKHSPLESSEQTAEGHAEPVSHNERVLRDALVERLNEQNGISTSIDTEQGQRVLDLANGKDVKTMSFGEPYDYDAHKLGRVEPNLAGREVAVVSTDSNHGFSNYKEAKTWAKQNIAKTYGNEETGGKGEVRISNGAIDKFMSQSAVDKSDTKDVHMAVLKVLPEVLKSSIDVETHPDFLKGENGKRSPENGINKDVLVHRCYGAVDIDGKTYRVKITLKEDVRNKNVPHNAHSYEATKIELLEGTLVKPEDDNPNTNNSISAAKLLSGVDMSYNPGVKVLDASSNESDAKITDHVRYFRTPSGEAYGFTVGGQIYIDPRIAKSDTPIHEYTHLWAEALRRGNAEEWKNVVGLMKGTSLWEEVKKRYPELKTDDEIADEVLAHYSGQRGAERLREEAKRIADGNGGVFEKAEAISALERVKKALANFWKGVCDFLHIHFTSAEEVADRVMKDLLDGVDPRKFGKTDGKLRMSEEAETKDIIAKAKADGTYMKAPNDEPTKLNERQWAQVRTKAFKEWFGDWENDPKNASKVVDENGEPLVVYHGTTRGIFTVFDTNGEGKTKNTGSFFAENRSNAGGYAYSNELFGKEDFDANDEEESDGNIEGIFAVFLNVRNPEVRDFGGNSWSDIYGNRWQVLNEDGDIEMAFPDKGTAMEYVNKRQKETGENYSLDEDLWTETIDDFVRDVREDYTNDGQGKDGVYAQNIVDGADYEHEDNEWIVFSPNQIKSATDNVGTFDAGNDDIRYQFVGERGAERADHAEEVTKRLDNLKVAREMEEAKKDAKAIKMATGWERGADGKWRYEIDDLKYYPKGDAGLEEARSRKPWSKELDGLSERIFDGEELSEKEMSRFYALADEEAKWKADYLNREKPHLADWIEDKELFAAYPDLKRVEVVFTDQLPQSTGGYYNDRDNRMVVNTNYVGDTASVIVHEVQHAIQYIEGFARGGSPEYFDAVKKAIGDIRESVDKDLDDAAKTCGVPTILEWSMSLDDEDVMSVYAERKELSKQHKEFALSYVYLNHAGFKKADRELLKSKLDEANEMIAEQKRNIGNKYNEDSYTTYQSLAGEVEARNVQKRMGMSADERRRSLAAETEDVAREDQIFLYGDGGESHMAVSPSEMSDGEKARRGTELAKAHAVDVKSGQIVKTESQSARKAAEEWWSKHIGKPLHYDTEVGQVEISSKSIGTSLAHRYSQAKLDAITSLKDGFGNAVYLGTIRDFIRTAKSVQNHYFAYPINYEGRRCYVFCRAMEDNNKNRLYVHEVFVADNIQSEGNTLQTAAQKPHGGIALYKSILSDVLSTAKVAENSEIEKASDAEDGKTKFRLLEDDDPKAMELEALPESELVPVYRNVQVFADDEMGSPMAFTDAETGERRTLQGGKWNAAAQENVELTPEQQQQLDELNKNGYIVVDGKKTGELKISKSLFFKKGKTGDAQLQYWLKKNPEDKGVPAAYDPYDHAIETPLNTQFGTAFKRPNLVVVRSLIPKSEIDEPHQAKYALLPTGAHEWNNGRTLYLSRWSKIDKVLTRQEEAKLIDEYWKKNPGKREALKSHRDYNRFVPQVRQELEKMGYRFELDGKELTPEESRALDEQNWENRNAIPGMEGHVPYVSNEDIARINSKMAGKWVGEPKAAMENAMTERVNELSERLHTPVHIIRTEEEVAALPTARQRRMKGSYNPMTGEVTIVVPNNANLADVENTFMHEVVGHNGLRVLFPEEGKLNNALDELYRVSNSSIQQDIDRRAQKMYDAEVERIRERKRKQHEARGENAAASHYTDMAEAHMEASKQKEQFKRDAAEEYAADLAGRIGEENFEKMSAEEQTFWGKLKAMLQKALQKLLEGLKIPGGKKWSDKEWAYVLHESYKRKKNGGKPSFTDAADTEIMREKTGFGEPKFSEEKREPQTANERFNSELTRYQNGEMDKNEMLHLGRPQGVMRAFLPDLPIVMRQRILTKGSVRKHNVAIEALTDMPNHLSHPIFVFKRSDNALGVLTEMQDRDGKNVCVAIELNRQIQNGGEILEVNDIRSVHGRNVADIVYPIVQNGTLKWADKEKGLAYLSSASQYVQQEIDKQDLNTAAKVVENFENPNVSDENNADDAIMFRDGDSEEYSQAMASNTYENRVASGMYQMQEALQDSMLGLKEAMQSILKAEGRKMHIEEVDDFENAYLGENRLSSTNRDESERFAQTLFKPLLKEVARLAPTADARAELTDYLMAKHGLERNEVMARRSAQKQASEEFAAKLRKAQRAVDNDPLNDLALQALDTVKQDMHDREEELYFANRGRDYAGLTALTGMEKVADAEAEAQQMVLDNEASHEVANLWDKVNAVTESTLQKTYESGLISKDTYDDIRGMYHYYIPLRGFDDKTSEEAYAYLGSKHSVLNSPIKTAKGRKSKADDPLASMEQMAESAIIQGNRNVLVKQTFLNFALNHPSNLVSVSNLWLRYDDVRGEWQPVGTGDIAGTEALEADDTPQEVERKMQDFEEAMQALANSDPDHFKRQKDYPQIPYRVVESTDLRQHQVLVKRGGRAYLLTINGSPRAAQALNGQTNPDNDATGSIGKLLHYGETVNRWLSSVYTTRNPDFVVSNFLRDLLYANTMVWAKESPNYAMKFHLNVARLNPIKIKALIAKRRSGKLNMNNPTEAMFELFMKNGGETGYVNLRDTEQRKNDIRRTLKAYNSKLPLRQAWKLLGERLDEYNRAVENCARFAAFMTSRQMGRSIGRSIWDAKEISVNFNKKGSGSKFLDAHGQTPLGNLGAFTSGMGRALYVFWNAALQGTTNFGRQLGRHPAKALSGAAAMFLMGYLVGAIGGSDDDDDKNSYFNLPEYTRRSNIMFRLPGMSEQWVSIPLPVEYRALYGMGELAASVLSGHEHYNAGEIASQMASQVSQILPIDFMEGGGSWKAFIPSSVKPVAEVASNQGWTGMPIYKDTAYNQNDPEWTKAYKSANQWLVGGAKWLNEQTGGDDYTRGFININPAQVEYLLSGTFGGIFTTIDKLVKMGETAAGTRQYDPRSFMFLNRLVKNGDERTEYRAVNNEYFRLKEEHDATKKRLRSYQHDTEQGILNYAGKINYLNHSPEYRRMLIFEGFAPGIDDISEALKQPLPEGQRQWLESEQYRLKKMLVDEANKTRQ